MYGAFLYLANTNALNILTPHVVIASPKIVAISFLNGCFVAQLLSVTNYFLRLH